jgi:diaminohydroxyphosphoribosylaminopyrimidine deaminase/5-amino-6-(5-phosphoribosylamino)uracil reductase
VDLGVSRSAMASDTDIRFMDLALTLGRRGLGRTWPNPSVGAVLVREEGGVPVIVGRGVTQPGGRPHAEPEAIRQAGSLAKGATLYVTLEPCSHHGKTPPCADATIAAGIARVVSAMEDPNTEVAGKGHARLRAAGVQVDVGLGAEEAARAHAGHIRRIRDGRPHVMLKLGVSADGKVGLPGRKPVRITGDLAWERVHRLRAQHDAVLTGIGTVLSDDPKLTCRLPGMMGHSPIRVLLDSKLRLPVSSELVKSAHASPVWVFGSRNAPPSSAAGIEMLSAAGKNGMLDLSDVLRQLAARGITRLMVEAGPRVAASFLTADLVDEVALFTSPNALGEGIDALEGLPLTALTRSPRLVSRGIEKIGADTLETFERK